MRINEHDLDSLRRLIRELQQENGYLKTLLQEHGISYEAGNILEKPPVPDEYDEDLIFVFLEKGIMLETERLSLPKRVREKCGVKYQWRSENVDVPLMHEKRTGYMNLMTKDDWEKI